MHRIIMMMIMTRMTPAKIAMRSIIVSVSIQMLPAPAKIDNLIKFIPLINKINTSVQCRGNQN